MNDDPATDPANPSIVTKSELCRVLLVDASPLRRAGLKRLLEDWKEDSRFGLLVSRAAASLDESAPADAVALVIFSIGAASAEALSIVDAIRTAKRTFQTTPIVVLSDRRDAPDVVAALGAGARGFIATDIDPSLMFLALKFIASGGVFFPPEVLLDLCERPEAPVVAGAATSWDNHAPILGLTARQKEVLRLLRQGHSNKRIAIALSMCEATVKVHVRQIMRKLGALNRTQAALCAADLDLQDVTPVEARGLAPPSVEITEQHGLHVLHG